MSGAESFFHCVPIARRRDAVGRMALGLRELTERQGFRSLLFTENQQSPRIGKFHWGPLRRGLLKPDPTWGGHPAPDLALYHHSIGTAVAERFLEWPAKYKILVYHNITPSDLPHLSESSRRDLIWGREQLVRLVANTELQIGLSEFTCRELRALGGQNVTHLPYLLWKRKLRPQPRPSANPLVLIVGRVSPHKRILEGVQAFARFRAAGNPKAQLAIVGNHRSSPEYLADLRALIQRLRLQDAVEITGKVSDRRLRSFYERASVLLTLSDHEGFCVPVAEAMLAGIPIVAISNGALPETVGEGGILVPSQDPAVVAPALQQAIGSDRDRIVTAQKEEIARFHPDRFWAEFRQALGGLNRAFG